MCLHGIFGLLLVLLLPFAVDGHNHRPYSIESSQTPAASCLDVLSGLALEAKTALHSQAECVTH